MSFTAAVIAVLAASTVFLGLLAHNLVGRLERLESVIAGGLTAPPRPLAREEFARRWQQALARSAFASAEQSGVYLCLDPTRPEAKPFVDTLAALTTAHDLTVIAPTPASSGSSSSSDSGYTHPLFSGLASGNFVSGADDLLAELHI